MSQITMLVLSWLICVVSCLLSETDGQLSRKSVVASCPASQVSCMSTDDNVAVFPAEGSLTDAGFYIGGIFPVHSRSREAFTCGTINTESFQEMMAFQWAVETSSRRLGSAVPNVAKGTLIFDTCGADFSATKSIFGMEKCKTKPALGARNNVTVTSTVDRSSVFGYISGLDGRNGQMSDEASHVVLALQKPLISTGTYGEQFANRRPGSRQNFVAPTIRQQIEATVDVISQSVTAGEIFVSVVYSAEAFSSEAFMEFQTAARTKNICIVYGGRMNTPVQDVELEVTARNLLINRDARFVISLLDGQSFRKLYRGLLARTNNILNFTFVFPPFAENVGEVLLETSVVALGAIQIRHNSSGGSLENIEDFRNFYRAINPIFFPNVPLVSEFWQQRFQCNLIGYTGNRALSYRSFCSNSSSLALQDDAISGRVGYVIQAVDALLTSIESVRRAQCSSSDFCPAMTVDKFDEVIPNVMIQNRRVFNSETGGPESWRFEVFNLKLGNIYTKVGFLKNGQYNQTQNMVAYVENGTGIITEEGLKSDCPPGKCFLCRPPPPGVTPTAPPSTTAADDMLTILPRGLATHRMSHNAYITGIHFRQKRSNYTSRLLASEYRSVWSVALAVLAGLGIIAVLIVEGTLIYLLKTYKFIGPDGMKTTHFNYRVLWLGQLLLFGIFLSYLTLFAYLPVPTKATCGITRFGVGISYAIMFSCILVKLMIILSTRVTDKFLAGEIQTPFYQRVVAMVALFLAAFSIQLIITIQWLIQVPPEAVHVRDNGGRLVWICNHYTWSMRHSFWDMRFFVRTEFDNHLLSLIYIMFLILVTFLFSLKAFDLVTNMRESRFVTLAVGISIVIFIPWAMIGGFMRDHVSAHEIGDGCIGFGLFFTATVILFAMFLPKVRQLATIGLEGVFLEDDKETTYASSTIYSPNSTLVPGGHRSMSGYADGSMIGMQTMDRSLHLPAEDLSSRPIINIDTSFMSADPSIYDPNALRLIHPRSTGPSLYSVRSTPNLYDPSEQYRSRAFTRDLTGRGYINESFAGSEYPSLYRPKSELLLYKSPRSDIGSL